MKIFINNKNNEKICVEVNGLKNKANKKLVFFVHGLSVDRYQPELLTAAKAFIKKGYVTVSFDSRFSFGESYGELEDTSLTNSIEDLKTVIDWASNQDFYVTPFSLCGHSLGGGAILDYAENNPDMVEFLIPLAPIVTGQLMIDAWRKTESRAKILHDMETTGKSFRRCTRDENKCGYVSYNFIKDVLKYDFIKNADKLNMPVLLITGDSDVSSTIYNNSKLFEALKGDVTFEILTEAGHNYDNKKNQKDLYNAVYKWLSERLYNK